MVASDRQVMYWAPDKKTAVALKCLSTHSAVVQSFTSDGDQKKGRIQPENFCVCAPENCPLQGGAESWTYWATI